MTLRANSKNISSVGRTVPVLRRASITFSSLSLHLKEMHHEHLSTDFCGSGHIFLVFAFLLAACLGGRPREQQRRRWLDLAIRWQIARWLEDQRTPSVVPRRRW